MPGRYPSLADGYSPIIFLCDSVIPVPVGAVVQLPPPVKAITVTSNRSVIFARHSSDNTMAIEGASSLRLFLIGALLSRCKQSATVTPTHPNNTSALTGTHYTVVD